MANETAVDDVTTIFVVGFPDDMSEREFQNMFLFSPGFEAASLKWHCKDQEDETLVAPNNGKKQMIGFARFRMRSEAMQAAEVLNGKKVDQEKGTLLKAEMAKKNLHIKRGSIAPVHGHLPTQHQTLSTPATLPAQDTLPTSVFAKRFSMSHHDTMTPLLNDLLSPLDYLKPSPFANDPFSCSTPTTPIFSDSIFGFRSQSMDARSQEFGFMSPPRGFGLPPPHRANILQDSIPENDPFHYLSKSSPTANDNDFGFGTSFFNTTPHDGLASRVGSLSFHPPSISNGHITEAHSPSFSSPNHSHSNNSTNNSSNGSSRSFNPADQNPPCNTLYVGNLPPNTSEDELRLLFSQCHGYKRMSFRSKSQGPMCFVEFEGVIHAAQAMNDLQGFMLTNSVKGGIRLSFSKNPLFTKPTKQHGMDRKDLIFEHPLGNVN